METPAKRDDAGSFKTPRAGRLRGSSGGTPIAVPASPFMKKLGCGTGVSVYLLDRGDKLDSSPWAVKKINSRCPSQQLQVYQRRLSEEAQLLRGIQHPNIVGFRAVGTASDGSKCLAMEYGGEQSLYDLIEKRKEAGLGAFPADQIHKVALHMARGLQYLHNEKKLLHGDIKSCNVVVRGDFQTVKLCDVGVSLPLDENLTVSDPEAEYVGTEPWKPREVLEEQQVTHKADVFAYGLTLWEMMTLDMPHLETLGDDDRDEDQEDEESFDEDAYYERLGTRPPLHPELLGSGYRQMVELFYVCTEQDPCRRPSAAQVVRALEGGASADEDQEVTVD